MVQFIIDMVFIAIFDTFAVIATNPKLRQMVDEWLEGNGPQNEEQPKE